MENIDKKQTPNTAPEQSQSIHDEQLEAMNSPEMLKVLQEINEQQEKVASLDKESYGEEEQKDIDDTLDGFEEKKGALQEVNGFKEMGRRAEAAIRDSELKNEEKSKIENLKDIREQDNSESNSKEESKIEMLKKIREQDRAENKEAANTDSEYDKFEKQVDKELEKAENQSELEKQKNIENLKSNPLIEKVEDLRNKEEMLERDLEYKKKHVGEFGFTKKDLEKAERELAEVKAEHQKALDEAGLDKDIEFKLRKFEKEKANSWFNRQITSVKEKHPKLAKTAIAFNNWRKEHPYLYQTASFALTATIGLGVGAAVAVGTGGGAAAVMAAGFAGAKTSVAMRVVKMPLGMLSGWVGSKLGAATHEIFYSGKYKKQHIELKGIESLLEKKKTKVSPEILELYKKRITKAGERVDENKISKKNIFKGVGALVGVGAFIGANYAGAFDGLNTGVREVVNTGIGEENIPHTPEPNEGGQETITDHKPTVLEQIENGSYEVPADAVIGKGEGITHAYLRQLQDSPELCEALGIKGVPSPADAARLAMEHGYISADGSEVRVMYGQGAAYDLEIIDGKVEVIESKGGDVCGCSNPTFMEQHGLGAKFEGANHETYEYIHKAGAERVIPETAFSETKPEAEIEFTETETPFSVEEPVHEVQRSANEEIDLSGLQEETPFAESVQQEKPVIPSYEIEEAPEETFDEVYEQQKEPVAEDKIEKQPTQRELREMRRMERMKARLERQRLRAMRGERSFFGGLWRGAVKTAVNAGIGGFMGAKGVNLAGGIDINHHGGFFERVVEAAPSETPTNPSIPSGPTPSETGDDFIPGTSARFQ